MTSGRGDRLAAACASAALLVGAAMVSSAPVTTAAGSGTVSLPEPVRLLDTRSVDGVTIDGKFQQLGRVGPNHVLDLGVAGRGGIPADPVPSAVFFTITVTNPSGPGYITAYPCGESRPTASNVTIENGLTSVANAVARPNADGAVCLYIGHTNTDVVIDVFAYSSAVESDVPFRLMDTREDQATEDGQHAGDGPVSAGSITRVAVAGRGWVPADAAVVFVVLAAVIPESDGAFTVYPCGTSRPSEPQMLVTARRISMTLVASAVGAGGDICVHSTTATELIVDLHAYSLDAAAAPSISVPPAPGAAPDSPDPDPPTTPVLVPLAPGRYWDTRPVSLTFDDTFNGTGRLAADTTFKIPVVGRGGIVPDGATGVAVNLTAIAPSAPGYATVYPCSAQVPLVSTVNYLPGEVNANSVVVPLSSDGAVCVYTLAASDFVLDVGAFVDPESPQVGVDPARFLETRQGEGAKTFDSQAQGDGRVVGGEPIRVAIGGRGDIPAGAQAVMVNVTVVNPSANGFVTIYQCGAEVPEASSVNYLAGQVVPNGAIVALSGDGDLCVYSLADADVLIDVTGFIPAGVDSIVTFDPVRLFDSRPGQPLVDGTAAGPRLTAGEVVKVTVRGRNGIPSNAVAAFFNLGAVVPDGHGHLTLWPCTDANEAVPTTSNVNYAPGGLRSNNTTTMLSADGSVCIYTHAATDVILDITGYVLG